MKYKKYAFITGCSGSLGKDILQNILKKKYRVICHSRKINEDLKKILNQNKKNIKKVLNFDLLDKKGNNIIYIRYFQYWNIIYELNHKL
jgi:short-subunit dehydrogenase